jgi:peptidoglycan lytic transglycosylase
MLVRGDGSGSVGVGASRVLSHAAAPSLGLRITAIALTATTLAITVHLAARAEAQATFLDRWWPATETLRTALALAAQGRGIDMHPRQAAPAGYSLASVEPAAKVETVLPPRRASSRRGADGIASYYGSGSRTASGEKFNTRAYTAAHRTLPFGTRVRVTNVSNGQSVMVRINDRGPFIKGRVIDVSPAAAEELGMVGRGLAKVKLDVVK